MSPITVQATIISSTEPSQPNIAIQVTCLVDSYMIWAGTTDAADNDMARLLPAQGTLCRDWACAMPPPLLVSQHHLMSNHRLIAVSLAHLHRLPRCFVRQRPITPFQLPSASVCVLSAQTLIPKWSNLSISSAVQKADFPVCRFAVRFHFAEPKQ